MSVTSGFFDSASNEKRKYYASDFGKMFDGVIEDGVFANYGEAFKVVSGGGRNIIVKPGRAWLNHKWILNDSDLTIELANTGTSGYRIDVVCLYVDDRLDVKKAGICVKTGSGHNLSVDYMTVCANTGQDTSGGSTVYIPDLDNTDLRKEYPIAYVVIAGKDADLQSGHIFYKVGNGAGLEEGSLRLDFVTCPLDHISADVFISRMEGEWSDFKNAQYGKVDDAVNSLKAKCNQNEAEFDAWFADLKAVLADDVATALASRLLDVETKTENLPLAPEMHRNIYRGKDLGTKVTDLQKTAIGDGTFDDIYVGDHWTLGDYTNLVDVSDADFQYNKRLNNTGGAVTYVGCHVTGYIPFTVGDVIRAKYIKARISGQYCISFYDSSKTYITSIDSSSSMLTMLSDNKGFTCTTATGNGIDSAAYIRVAGYGDTNEFIVTINEELNSIKWLVADMDYWYTRGAIATLDKHHLAIIPENVLYTGAMYNTAPTEGEHGGYYGSDMYVTGLTEALRKARKAFGSLVLEHDIYVNSGVSNYAYSGNRRVQSTVELMNEIMVCGTVINTAVSPWYSDNKSVMVTNDCVQLSLFRLAPKFMRCGTDYWLRDPLGGKHWSIIDHNGTAGRSNGTTSALGVRPIIAVGL